jgi:uncharacterized protein (DUF1800 family)
LSNGDGRTAIARSFGALMSNPAKAEAVFALHRFGLGPRPGSIAAIAADPRGALLAELDRPPALLTASVLPSSGQALRTVAEFNDKRQAKINAAKRAQDQANKDQAKKDQARQDQAKQQQMADAATPASGSPNAATMAAGTPEKAAGGAEAAAIAAADAVPNPRQKIYLDEARIRTEAALSAEIGFAERLVWFWSNHFCVSADSIRSMAGAYEREAIRPHVLGRFTDLVLSAEGHPAMLYYLGNLGSMGANSIAGLNRARGLNENLAREVMELHTLGVRSGYSQDDVISFANVLTGWTWLPPADNPEHGGEFSFNPRLHEPGAQTVLGKTYADEGVEQGRAVLRDLAAHPATATHVAGKLARHFVADTPPPELVERMAKVFLDTSGDLKEVAKTMVTSPEAWVVPPAKLKRPGEWVVGVVRASGLTEIDPARFTGGQALLGEGLWRPSSPKGFADDEASWIDGVGRRLDIANNFAEREAGQLDPEYVVDTVLEGCVSAEVREAVGHAESRQQALTLLFMAAEFQRR